MLLFSHGGTGSQSSSSTAQAIDLDGTNDYLSKASDLTGNADGKTFTVSSWVYVNGSGTVYIYSNYETSLGLVVQVGATGTYQLIGRNAAGTIILNASASIPIQTLVHVVASIDLANSANRSIYVQDVAASVTWTTYTNDNIDFTKAEHYVNRIGTGSTGGQGRLAHVYLDYSYKDLSNSANRRLFITADRKPASGQAALNPILYLKCDDPATSHVNSGTGGNFTLNGTIARSGRGPNQFNAAYSDLDGSADYLSRTSALTGIADGKQFTLSFCLNADDLSSTQRIFKIGSSDNLSNAVDVFLLNTGQLRVNGTNATGAGGTTILQATTSGTAFVVGRNYHVAMSFDLTSSSLRHVYINGQSATVTWTTYTDDTLNLLISSNPRTMVGASHDASGLFNGRLGEVFFHTSYIDLSIAANLAKFVAGTGIDAKPVDPGANGELPLGTSPLIYLPMYGNNAGKNYGTGGDFTVNSGPYTGARGPNEFWGNKATFNGTTGVISKTSQLTGAADGKVFLLSFFVNKNASTLYTLIDTTGAAFRVTINASNQLVIVAENAGGSTILSATVTTTIANTTNTHVLVSIDLANSSNRAVYLNGVAASVTWTTYTNDSIDFTVADFYVGSETGGSNKFAGWLAEFFFATPAAYVDISQEATRLKFRDAFGNCVDLGADGSTPTESQPIVYLRFDPAAFGTNAGSGGAFTASNITDGGQL